MYHVPCLQVDASSPSSFDMWYMPLLQPWVDHVPVSKDLHDLQARIQWCRDNDAACQAMVAASKRLYDAFVCREGVLDYNALLMQEMAACLVYSPCEGCREEGSGSGCGNAAEVVVAGCSSGVGEGVGTAEGRGAEEGEDAGDGAGECDGSGPRAKRIRRDG